MSKTSRITLFPGVSNQGLKSYIFQYPFYSTDTISLELNPGNVQNYTPKTRYLPELTASSFLVKVNFEEGPGFDKLSGDTTLFVEKQSSMIFEGAGSGVIYLDTAHKTSENKSRGYFGTIGDRCYAELDYKSTLPFQIGIYAEKADGSKYEEYLAGFNPRGEWTKIYVDLATFVKTYSPYGYNKYYLKLRSSLKDFSGKYTEGYVLFDNIKVISR
jgi:hypothetical protein